MLEVTDNTLRLVEGNLIFMGVNHSQRQGAGNDYGKKQDVGQNLKRTLPYPRICDSRKKVSKWGVTIFLPWDKILILKGFQTAVSDPT